jgi:hypothetical protein
VISGAQFGCSIFLYFTVATSISAQGQSTVPTNNVIAQMVQAQTANRIHFRPYIVTRDYKLFEGENPNRVKSSVVAEITVVPTESKVYSIKNTDGSGWGETIVRRILDGEVALAKDSASTDITPDNYDFRLVREDQLSGQRCYVLELVPRRQSRNLLRGTIWVDAKTYLPYRVEGIPTKNPSWWLRDIRIVLLYGPVGEMWLQTSSEATANVRIIGRSSMISRDVKYQIGEFTPGAPLTQTVFADVAATIERQR